MEEVNGLEVIQGDVRSEPLNRNFSYIDTKLDSVITRRDLIEVDVGNTGDFPTLKMALEFIVDNPLYPFRVVINLLDDYILKEQIMMENKDLRFITIRANSIINVEPTNLNSVKGVDDLPVFYGYNVTMPKFEVKFRFNQSKTGSNRYISGMLLNHSNCVMLEGSGFVNFPYNGLRMSNNSSVIANHCDFSHNGNRSELSETNYAGIQHGDGIMVERSSLKAEYSTADSCGNDGYNFVKGSVGDISYSSAKDCGHHSLNLTQACVVNAMQCTFTGTIDNAVVAYASSSIDLRGSDCSDCKVNAAVVSHRGSHITFDNGKANNAGGDGLQVKYAATINFDKGEAINCGGSGIHLTLGGMVTAEQATIRGSGKDGIRANTGIAYLNNCEISNSVLDNINIRYGSHVTAYNCNLDGAGSAGFHCAHGTGICSLSSIKGSGSYGIQVTGGGDVIGQSCTIENSGSTGVYSSGATVDCTGSTIKDSGNYSVQGLRGAYVRAYNVSASGAVNDDFVVSSGATMTASESTGTANVDLNQLTGSGYIISNTLTR